MNESSRAVINPEFLGLYVDERSNPYRSCIQGLANEPVTVLALLRRAEAFLRREPDFGGLGDYSQQIIVERLAGGRPRVCIIQGSADHPAHLFDHEHTLRAAALRAVTVAGSIPACGSRVTVVAIAPASVRENSGSVACWANPRT